MDAALVNGDTPLDKYLQDKMDKFFEDLQEKTMKWMTETLGAFRLEINAHIAENKEKIDTLREDTKNAMCMLREEMHSKDSLILSLQAEIEKQKRASLEQGVHDRKRDLLLSDIPMSRDETPASLENKIRENFVSKLDIPQTDVDKYIFTARHRLQKNENSTSPPKVICVLVDLDHVNQVLAAARKKGRNGQHVQNHLPQALQKWKSHCLYQRRLLIDNGSDPKDVRIRERRGFTTLQIREGQQFSDKLTYVVSVYDTPFPCVIPIPPPTPRMLPLHDSGFGHHR